MAVNKQVYLLVGLTIAILLIGAYYKMYISMSNQFENVKWAMEEYDRRMGETDRITKPPEMYPYHDYNLR